MHPRLLASIGFTALLVGAGCEPALSSSGGDPVLKAQLSAASKPSDKKPIEEALEAARDNPLKAITILEAALKAKPDDREPLFLLSVIASVEGQKATDKAERIALLHKSSAAYGQLRKLYPQLTSNEKNFGMPIQVNEARALALEGKTAESFQMIKTVIAEGYEEFDVFETDTEFEQVQKLPEFRPFMDSLDASKLAEALKEVPAELARTRPFPFDFVLRDLDDKVVSLADYRGKLTIVDVWGTWCPPCRKEIPHFVALYKKFKDKGLEIVGINCNEAGTPAEVKKTIRDFVSLYKIEYKCLLDDGQTETRIPGFSGFPTTLFLDATGKVRLVVSGLTSKARLEAIVTTLLAEAGKSPASK